MTDQDVANIKIPGTDRSPEVDFDFQNNVFAIRGESYPEDVIAFYGQIIGQLTAHLEAMSNNAIQFDFELIYFNSSTAKVLMDLFDKLEETANNGNDVQVNWYYDKEDDTMQELGQEFAEDLDSAKFSLKELET